MPLSPHFLSLLHGEQPPGDLGERLALSLLGGVGAVYGGIMAARAGVYRHRERYRAPCPVISVGNLTTGGTGKTPMALWLAEKLLAMGRQPAIVSRGHGQQGTAPVTVVADARGMRKGFPEAADEAVLLARLLPGVAVLTGPRRCLPMAHAVAELGCDGIILDDGFQHLAVARDLDLVLLDAARPWGNGRLLPGGVLRELPTALKRADGVVITRADAGAEGLRRELEQRFPGLPVLTARHAAGAWRCWNQEGGTTPETPALAFAGIARPDGFRQTLARAGVPVAAFHPFPDHHPFTREELARLTTEARRLGARSLVCTEKDAVRLDAATLDLPLWTLGVRMAFLEEPLWLLAALERL